MSKWSDLSGSAVNAFRSIKLQKSEAYNAVAKTGMCMKQSPQAILTEVNLQEACYIGVCTTCYTLSDLSERAMTHFYIFIHPAAAFIRSDLQLG